MSATQTPISSRAPEGFVGGSALSAGWLVLAIDDLRLALPQTDVRQVTLASDLEGVEGDESRGLRRLKRPRGKPWLACHLDHNLRPERSPGARRLCVFFGASDGVLGLLCTHTWLLAAASDLRVEPVPRCLIEGPTPIIGMAFFQEAMAVVSDGRRLGDYLTSLRVSVDGDSL